MSIKVNNITDLKSAKNKKNNDILTDADYKLREKSKEEPEVNTRDITNKNVHLDKVALAKAELQGTEDRAKMKAELLAELRAELLAEPKATTKAK